jgi:hypothetical protein
MIPRTYPTFELALRRVEVLKSAGIWPGIVCQSGGWFRLTFDPGAEETTP